MAALLATSSCLAQDALPDLPDVPEMPAIGTTVNSRLDRRRLLHGGVPTGGMPAIGTTSESLYSMGRRSLQQYPGINMPGPFLAGGWSDVSVDERFQDLVNVFNYVARRAVSERQRKHQGGDPAVVRGQEPGGGRHELLHEPVARLCGRGRQEERDRVSVPGRTVRNHGDVRVLSFFFCV